MENLDVTVTIDRVGASWKVRVEERGKVQAFLCPDEATALRFGALFAGLGAVAS